MTDHKDLLDACRTSLGNHTKHITSLKKFVNDSATKDDMRKITVQLGRFALYDDYKLLYNKTVLPV